MLLVVPRLARQGGDTIREIRAALCSLAVRISRIVPPPRRRPKAGGATSSP